MSTLKFDGSSQYFRVSDSDVFDFGEEGTIFIVAQGHNTGTWRPIISKRGENGMGWQFRRVNTDFTAFTLRGTSDWDDRSGERPLMANHMYGLCGNLKFEKLNGRMEIWNSRSWILVPLLLHLMMI